MKIIPNAKRSNSVTIGKKEYESAIVINKDNEPVAVIDKVIFEKKENE